MGPRAGDVIHDLDQVETWVEGTVLLDNFNEVYKVINDVSVYVAESGSPTTLEDIGVFAPFRVLHVPGKTLVAEVERLRSALPSRPPLPEDEAVRRAYMHGMNPWRSPERPYVTQAEAGLEFDLWMDEQRRRAWAEGHAAGSDGSDHPCPYGEQKARTVGEETA